nr:polyprotein [Tradescantia mild mosaic virus]
MAIMFGKFPCKLVNNGKGKFEYAILTSRAMIQEEQDKVDKAFATLDALFNDEEVDPKEYLSTGRNVGFSFHKKRPQMYEGIENIITGFENQVKCVHKEEHIEVSIKKPRTIKKHKVVKVSKPVSGSASFNTLLNGVVEGLKKRNQTIEVVGKRPLHLRKVIYNNKPEVMTQVKHKRGIIHPIDANWDSSSNDIIERITQKVNGKRKATIQDFGPGSSGIVLLKERLEQGASGFIVIRGRLGNELLCSTKRIRLEQALNMRHYTDKDIKQKFTQGIDIAFSAHKHKIGDHICNRDYDPLEVGKVCGTVIQLLIPSALTTCGECVRHALELPENEIEQLIKRRELRDQLGAIQTPTARLAQYTLGKLEEKKVTRCNPCITAEAIKLASGVNEAPMRKLCDLASYIGKGNGVDQSEINAAMGNLIEVIRWFRKRTDNIRAGSVATFKNKITSKNHINLALMHDKLLDDDGNFEWGERGIHSKRFRDEFFDIIDPTEDYGKHALRRHIRGERLLSIKNLLVHTDPEKMMKAIVAHPIAAQPITQACISTIHGNYLYSCSCSTLEDGNPALSRYYPPVKNHLAIGNTGDLKLVVLPKQFGNLRIAKEGYCYVHIFLSMLMFVTGDDAKDFTKLIRDSVIPALGKWPTMQNIAALCVFITTMFPATSQAELPVILVDHEHRTMHVLDSYGSANIHYHVLKATTVSQLVQLASEDVGGEIKNYNVGGDTILPVRKPMEIDFADYESDEEYFEACVSFNRVYKAHPDVKDALVYEEDGLTHVYSPRSADEVRHKAFEKFLGLPAVNTARPYKQQEVFIVDEQPDTTLFKALVHATYKKSCMERLITNEPYLLLAATLSMKTFVRCHKDQHFSRAILSLISGNPNLAKALTYADMLAQRVSIASTITAQLNILSQGAQALFDLMEGTTMYSQDWYVVKRHIEILAIAEATNKDLTISGFNDLSGRVNALKNQHFEKIDQEIWNTLSWREKFSYRVQSTRTSLSRMRFVTPNTLEITPETCQRCCTRVLGSTAQVVRQVATNYGEKCSKIFLKARVATTHMLLKGAIKFLPSFARNLDVFIACIGVYWLFSRIRNVTNDAVGFKQYKLLKKKKNLDKRLRHACEQLEAKLKRNPTEEEFREYLLDFDTELHSYYVHDEVELQAYKTGTKKIEQSIAFITLIMMLIDVDKSDALYHILNKIKGIFSTLPEKVEFQSLDDIKSTIGEQNTTVHIEIDQASQPESSSNARTFKQFWNDQITNGQTIPHHRTGGEFIEFTRKNCSQTALSINQNCQSTEFLVRGAVGSGKSTGLPAALMKFGKVLLLEPTRPLTDNVARQLSQKPFELSPTVRMRGLTTIGSSNIHVMTTGFAFQHLAHNVDQIKQYAFIMFDECHVVDSHSMALYSLLKSVGYEGKILKVSATPPGKEVEFETQFPVTLSMESSLSFSTFVEAQGTGANASVIEKGDNILVYVSSYNDVDSLSGMLINKGYHVTKVDGRTMKLGQTTIVTRGTSSKKHFIVATNIIENGVTLDIDVVVDFGLKVKPILQEDDRIVRYQKTSIAYGERIQRMGRVGRIRHGHVLRIGHTETGLQNIPELDATHAAMLCFVHNLPVMTGGVVLSSLENITVKQARTAMNFELPFLYTLELIRHDGAMHPEIHKLLTPFKLRESETVLIKTAIPFGFESRWIKASDYNRLGANLDLSDDNIRVPYCIGGIPDKLHEEIYKTCKQYRSDGYLTTLTATSAEKIAYTLKTDIHSLPRTIKILEMLKQQELIRQTEKQFSTSQPISGNKLSFEYAFTLIRNRYTQDYTAQNLEIIDRAINQIKEFANLSGDTLTQTILDAYPYVQLVQFESRDDFVKQLQLVGRYKTKEIFNDAILAIAVLLGGSVLALSWAWDSWQKPVEFQGRKQKLRAQFKQSRMNKNLQSAFGSDDVIAQNFGEAYRSKGKTKGHTRGTGTKVRKFTNFYGFDPTEYDHIRFLDPITGYTVDTAMYDADVTEIQKEFIEARRFEYDDDKISLREASQPLSLKAYISSTRTGKAIEVDLTPHDPLAIGEKTNNISGFPDKEGIMRQSGMPTPVEKALIPKQKQYTPVEFEGKSLARGPRDYNPVGEAICSVTVETSTHTRKLHALGYGPYLIANAHLFEEHGPMTVTTRHGVYKIPSTSKLLIKQVKESDLVVLRMPKDYPPLPSKLNFRTPDMRERVVMLRSVYQNGAVFTHVSEESVTYPNEGCNFWRHWITTKQGLCGLPLVSTKDCNILGIHSLGSMDSQVNYMTIFPNDFKETYLEEDTDWTNQWNFNYNNVAWGNLYIPGSVPKKPFDITKALTSLSLVECQGEIIEKQTWLTRRISDNLQVVAQCPGNLITKHVVRGECIHFAHYLEEEPRAKEFFKPLMGFYAKSKLNKEAFTKDILKYAQLTPIGQVDVEAFERALGSVKTILRKAGIQETRFITDHEEVFNSLNKDAAVGALFSGKKKDYFSNKTPSEIEDHFIASAERLYNGQMGIWNGSLKAELRPIEKVEANKTRVFTAAPLDTLLAAKVCVDDFNNMFYDAHLKGPWTVGISKFFKGWDTFLRKLPEGWVYCDADGSQFDSSLTPFLMNAVLNIRLDFAENWDIGKQMLKNLYTEIVFTPIATPDGSVIKKHKGNNSGQPSTVVDNTMMVIIAMQYALELLNIPSENQDEQIIYFCNGDDLVIACRPDSEWILDQLQQHFTNLGMKYDFTSRCRERSELQFMSHTGNLRNGVYIPKLEKERIVAILEWDRSTQPSHRLDAIVAAMIEAWGYDDLLTEIRKFYYWLLLREPFATLAAIGQAPYLAETALRNLYLDEEASESEIAAYAFDELIEKTRKAQRVYFQSSDTPLNAGSGGGDPKGKELSKDVNAGSSGLFTVTPYKMKTSKIRMPKIKGRVITNIEHLLQYEPKQEDISNTRATNDQFEAWYEAVKLELNKDDKEMSIVLNGLMVWCIENGTSPSLNTDWTMMEGEEQLSFPIAPFIENAKPTFRQIMHHFSDSAETYIAMRNRKEKYMPRYGRMRNLRNFGLARYAFDFYEITSRTPDEAREACHQMKLAALSGSRTKLFGIDGKFTAAEDSTEHHTNRDAAAGIHNLGGARMNLN